MPQNFEALHPRRAEGKFDTKSQTSPELSLGDGSRKKVNARDYAAEIRDPATARLGAAAFLAELRYAVTDRGERVGLSHDDIDDAVSAAALDLTRHYLNTGKSVGRGLIQARALTITAQFSNGPKRVETVSALRVLSRRTIELEAKVGRPLTDAETAELATEIRETWPDPRHRPAANFHLEQVQNPVDYVDPAELADLDKTVGPAADVDTMSDHLMGELDRKPRPSDNKYELYAAAASLPMPWNSSFMPSQKPALTAAVEGRVQELAASYLLGARSPEHEALFAPFPFARSEELADLADALARNPKYAEELWAHAMTAATGKLRRSRVAA